QLLVGKVSQLNEIAANRGQTMAEMALAWALRDEKVTSLIVGSRNVEQLNDNLKALKNLAFSQDELVLIDQILDGATL
ncbi:MAG: aldo/keto reductase, partial [Synergistaceae bacterium]|nr:aldo/keto reductase [Synergistaceae bacterium]